MTNRALRFLIQNRKQYKLKRIIWFTWNDISKQELHQVGCGFCRKMGLLRRDGSPKPAYRRYTKWMGKVRVRGG